MQTLADRLIFLMENLDMKQTELAEKIGISKQSLYKYIHCQCEPRAEIIAKMAVALHSSADFLVGLTSDFSPIKRNLSDEKRSEEENSFFLKYRKLSKEDKIRIEERIDILLED